MGNLFIGETPADINNSPPGWLWLKPIEEGLEVYSLANNGEWVKQATISYDGHLHPALGDVNFIGSVSVNGAGGLSGSRVISGKRLTFTQGILTGYEDA